MFKYLLLSTLLSHVVWTKPAPQISELTPHVFIVTPQAQLQLDSLAHGTPVLQHLSPYTRLVTPHEETIVYIPSSAIGSRSVIPKFQFTNVLARSSSDISGRQNDQGSWISTACNNIPNIPNLPNVPQIPNVPDLPNLPQVPSLPDFPNVPNLPQVPNVPQLPSITDLPNLPNLPNLPSLPTDWQGVSEAANNVFPNLPILGSSPSANKNEANSAKPEASSSSSEASSSNANANQKLPILSNIKHIEYEIPVTPILVNEPRHQHYAAIIAPSPAQFVDYVQTPVFLSPSIPTIKGRSLENPIIAIPLQEISKPEALPLALELKKSESLQAESEIEKNAEISQKSKELKEIGLKESEEKVASKEQLPLSEEASSLKKQEEAQPAAELQPTAATKLDANAQEKLE